MSAAVKRATEGESSSNCLAPSTNSDCFISPHVVTCLTSHSKTVPSLLTLAKVEPSGEKATLVTDNQFQ